MSDPKDEKNTEHLEEGIGMGDNQKTDDPTPYDKARKAQLKKDADEELDSIDASIGLDMKFKPNLDDDMVKPDLDSIGERIDKMQDEMKCDQEEPMTTDRKIYMLSKIFAFAIGDRIKNLLDEEGIVDLVGLDRRGVLYLVQYKENVMRWEVEECIRKIDQFFSPGVDSPDDPTFKTDIISKKVSTVKKYTGEHRTD